MMDPNQDPLPFTPESLATFEKRTEELRIAALCDIDEAGGDPFAIQHFLAALAQLEAAQRSFTLAGLHQARGISGR